MKGEEKPARKEGRQEVSSRESSPCWIRASCWRAREEISMPGCREVAGGRKEAGELGKGSSFRVMLRGLDSIVRVIGNTETRHMMRFML